ncbi:sodium channel regulatory subunit beta-4 isoform X2 [Microcaecilia unicolor]|uniref:Sodium channel subunit beta-4 isoform X2 n=1 Tax=Microcaecilia unicolor TaxID=1415580 RepID=A0A6P7ZV83_9AMPH|nr:sodium channel subunit beta-4 isoform X2 [Microcaecilia unicolor]
MVASAGNRILSCPRNTGGGLLALCMVLYLPVGALGLEVSAGKNNLVTALNGSDVLLPCLFSTCIDFENVRFWWTYNSTDTFTLLYEGSIKNKQSLPKMKVKINELIELAPKTGPKEYNISLLIKNVDFLDAGKYTCHVINPKEKNAKQSTTVTLSVVDKFVKPDNTLMLIILAAVGGFIGFLILVFILKKVICFAIKKNQEKKSTL